jgi:hypothetical protein
MSERISQEIALLRERFPEVIHGLARDWILIPHYPLPEGRYNRTWTPLLVVLQKEYPSTAPDNFFVFGQLRLKDGSTPPGLNQGSQSSTGAASVGGDWSWFSWHPVEWKPGADIRGGDNLQTFLRGATACLEGKEQS